VRLREIQRAFLRRACGEVRCLREVRELALGRRAAVPLLERAARARRSAVIDARREENTRIISPLMPWISKPCPSSRAVHSSPKRPVRASSRCCDTIAATAPMFSL
jgi:hypothetical protein